MEKMANTQDEVVEEETGRSLLELFAQNPVASMSRLAWPTAVSMLSYALMSVIDTAFVGNKLGQSALSAAGVAGVLGWIIVCFGVGSLRAVKVAVSQELGNGRQDNQDYLGGGLVLAGIYCVLGILAGALLTFQMELFFESASTAAEGARYLWIRLVGTPAFMLYCAIREYRYAYGDMRSPMYASIIANIVNVVLNWVFLYVLEMDVTGAAWGTSIGQFVEAGVLFALARSDFHGLRQFRRKVASIFSLGWPMGLQFLLEVSAFGVLTAILARISDLQVAAHQVAIQVQHLVFLPVVALGEAAAVLAGHAVGAKRFELVGKAARISMMMALGYVLAFGTFEFIFAEQISLWFVSDGVTELWVAPLLCLGAVFSIPDVANIVYRCVLRGTGDVRWPAFFTIASTWIFLPPLGYLMADYYGYGAVGGWLAFTAEITFITVVLALRFHSGAWKKYRIVGD